MRQIVQTPQYGTKTARLPRSVAGEEFEMPPSMRQPLIQTFLNSRTGTPQPAQ
jgi:hypothetical protein